MEYISFKAMMDGLREDMALHFTEKLPFAAIVALTRTAVTVRDMLKDDMKRHFDRPTPYALNALRAVPATKQTQSSAVALKDFGNTPAGNYLGPEIEGGDRRNKRVESALQRAGIVPPGISLAPGEGAKLNQYGNIGAGKMVQVISALGASGEQGYSANATAKSKRKYKFKSKQTGTSYFVGTVKSTGEKAVFEILGSGRVSPILAFIRKPHYEKRFPFYDLARQHADHVFPFQLENALNEFK